MTSKSNSSNVVMILPNDGNPGEHEVLLKVVLVGNTAVGKTSLLLRYTDDCFSESFIATIGVDFKVRSMEVCGTRAKVQLWDTAGQDRFRTIISSFYRGAHGLIIVFDLTDMDSFRDVTGWLKEAQQYGNEQVIMLIVGNKCDLTAQRVVEHDAAQRLADSVGAMYVEASAKNATNVQQLFTEMAESLVQRWRQRDVASLDNAPDSGKVDIASTRQVDGWCIGSSTCSTL